MQQIRIVKTSRPTREREVDLDLRSPSGRVLPY
jgi:hypothetical protein